MRSIGPELVRERRTTIRQTLVPPSRVGATTGYQLAWVALLVAPLLGVVQTIAAQVGSVSHNDLQSAYRASDMAEGWRWSSWSQSWPSTGHHRRRPSGRGRRDRALSRRRLRWLVVPLGCALVGLLLVGKYTKW